MEAATDGGVEKLRIAMIPTYILTQEAEEEGWVTVVDGLSVKEEPKPEIPPPIWDSRPIDAEKCMAVVREFCK